MKKEQKYWVKLTWVPTWLMKSFGVVAYREIVAPNKDSHLFLESWRNLLNYQNYS